MSRLYVIIDEQYPENYRAVQGAHAVAEWLIKNPNSAWQNDFLIFLKDKCLDFWKKEFQILGKSFVEFVEPDVGNKTTALALMDDGKLFKNLELN